MCKALYNFLENEKLSIDDFAKGIGVERPSVGRYISGARIPTKEVMRRIYKFTHNKVTPNDFYELPPEVGHDHSNGVDKAVNSHTVSSSSKAGSDGRGAFTASAPVNPVFKRESIYAGASS